LLDPAEVSRQLLALRVGARLRGMEITADGRVERQGSDWVFCLSGSDEKLRLVPLTMKVQLDARRNRPQAPAREESLACERLCRDRQSPGAALRVSGPLVRPAPGAAPTLEVRDYWWFSPARPGASTLWLGLDVNGPYGLGEPWAVIREGLQSAGGWEWLAETPDLETATFRGRLSSGCWPDEAVLKRQLSAVGAGATLRGVEAAVEGWLYREHNRLYLRVTGCEDPIALAPLNRKIQRHGRNRSEARKTIAERGAHDQLRAGVGNEPRLVRVLGPVVQSQHGHQWLLEVRDFDLALPGETLPALTQDRREEGHGRPPSVKLDTAAPAPPGSLSAHYHDGRILLSWAECSEADLDGYNVFRTTTPGMGYIQIAAGIVPNSAAFRAEDAGVSYHYVVTARDVSGNESGYSTETTVRIPDERSKP
jgi:hypothetical protein